MIRIKKAIHNYYFRKLRVRKKVFGTAARPRLSVYRSLKHIYAQVIDDTSGRTVAFASTLDPSIRKEDKSCGNAASAARVGKLIAQKALSANVKKVVFDRSGRIYHGAVKALAEGARAGGLEF